MKKNIFAGCTMIALCALNGCSKQEQAQTERTIRKSAQTTVKTLEKGGNVAVKTVKKAVPISANAMLTGTVKTRLLADTSIVATGIDVTTKAEVVTLTGTVPNAKQKAIATKITRDTIGVAKVVNKLQIKK